MRGVVLVLLVLSLGVPLAGAAATKARLVIGDDHPVVVGGRGFHPREHVRLTVHAGATFRRLVVARANGTFSVPLSRAVINQCTGYSAFAVGDLGSRASTKVPGECPPPPIDGLMPSDPTPKQP